MQRDEVLATGQRYRMLEPFSRLLETAFVSYWEWLKLIVTAILISCALTTVALAPWWLHFAHF